MTDYKPDYSDRELYYARKDAAVTVRLANPGPEPARRTVEDVRCHDYRRTGWGHNCVFKEKLPPGDGSRWRGYGFGTGIRGGDYVMLLNRPQVAPYRVVKIEYKHDPPDMYWAEFEYHNGGFGVAVGDIMGPIVRRAPLPPPEPEDNAMPGKIRRLFRKLGRHR